MPSAGEQAAGDAFDIYEFRVLGNSVLPAKDIERAVYPLLGHAKSIGDVAKARDALATLYRDRGYGVVTVDIPEQDIVGGIVRLQVTEGRLDRVRVTGARYFSNGRIRESMASLEQGEVLNFPALQEDLLRLNRQTADRAVTPVLKAGRTPGTVDLELKVDDKAPAHWKIEVNDKYTADTSRTRAGLNLTLGNLFQKFHSLSLQYQTAPEEPDETRVLAATYVAPMGGSGQSVAVYAVDTNSDVSTVGTLSVLGAGRIFGGRYIIPLATTGSYAQSFILGVDYKDFDESIRLADSTDVTPIDYFNWSAMYSASGASAHTNNSFGVTANFGIRGFANEAGPPLAVDAQFFTPGEFGYKRAGAKPNYFYLDADARHERAFVLNTRLALRLSGQFSTEPLISNEQFAIGGADSVRGYLESEELGDYGLSGSLEWYSPGLVLWDWAGLALRSLVFYDAGIVSLIDPLPEQTNRFILTSAGAGIRMSGRGGLDASLDWAYPFKTTNSVAAGDARWHFRLLYGF